MKCSIAQPSSGTDVPHPSMMALQSAFLLNPSPLLQNTFQRHALIYNIVETNLKCFDQIGAWNSLGVLSSILLIV